MKKRITEYFLFLAILINANLVYGMEGDKRVFFEPSFNSQTFRISAGVSYLLNDFFEIGGGVFYSYSNVTGAEATISYNIDYFTFVPAIFLGCGLVGLPDIDYFMEGGAYLDYKPTPFFFIGIVYKFQTKFKNFTNFYGLKGGFYF